jgi:hypothetical protein
MDDKNYQEAPLLTTVEEVEQDGNAMSELSNNKGE